MNVVYDRKTDTLTIVLRTGAVEESDENRPGVILDYDRKGRFVSLEVLDASKRVEKPSSVTLTTEN